MIEQGKTGDKSGKEVNGSEVAHEIFSILIRSDEGGIVAPTGFTTQEIHDFTEGIVAKIRQHVDAGNNTGRAKRVVYDEVILPTYEMGIRDTIQLLLGDKGKVNNIKTLNESQTVQNLREEISQKLKPKAKID